MRTLILNIFSLFLALSGINAQNKSVESARVAFITQKINLTPVQAEKFWPVYNEFYTRKKEIKRTIRSVHKQLSENQDLSADKIKQSIVQINNLKQEEVNIEKEYTNRFLIILTPRQLADLILAEREFQKILIKKVSED